MSERTQSARETLGHAIERGKERGREWYRDARDRAADMRDRGREQLDRTRDYVGDHPLSSVLVGFTVGALLSALLAIVLLRR